MWRGLVARDGAVGNPVEDRRPRLSIYCYIGTGEGACPPPERCKLTDNRGAGDAVEQGRHVEYVRVGVVMLILRLAGERNFPAAVGQIALVDERSRQRRLRRRDLRVVEIR